MLTEYSYAFSLWLEAKAYAAPTIERYRQLLVSFEEFLHSDAVTDLNEIRQDHPEGFSRARERKYQEASPSCMLYEQEASENPSPQHISAASAAALTSF